MKTRIFILLQFILLSCFAQQYSYRHYTIFDGLPQNQVMKVFQRSDGIFFFATKNEVGGFDGNRFKKYKDKYISESSIEGFIGAGDQILWYTQKALVKYENENSTLLARFDSYSIHSMVISRRNQEAYLLSGSAFRVFKPGCGLFVYENDSIGLFSDVIRIPDSNDFFLSTQQGIYILKNGHKPLLLKECQGAKAVQIDDKIFFIVVHEAGGSTDFDGIYSFHHNTMRKLYAFGCNIPGNGFTITANKQIVFTQNNATWIRMDTAGHIVDRDSIPDQILTDIIEDNDGNLFIGSENGIWHLQSYAFRNYDWKSDMPRYVWSIFEDKDSSLVFATYHGCLFQMQNNVLSEVPNYRKNMVANEVFYMGGFCNSLGQWMIPTNYRIFINDHGQYKFLSLNHEGRFSTCLATYEDTAKKNVYFGTTNGLFIYNLITEKLKHIDTQGFNTLSIEKDRYGDLWICTGKNVLLLKSDSILISPNNSGLPDKGVVSCKKDTAGNMWYAAKDGLYFYNYDRHIKISDGHYYFITLWKNRKIIAGGVEGVTVIDLNMLLAQNTTAIQHFDRFNGFLGIECGQNGTCLDSRGQVWIPTSESVVCFDPGKTVYDTVPPKPFIVSFERSTKDLRWKEVDLPWQPVDSVFGLEPGQSNVRIVFDGLDYISLERMKFKYRLSGYSEIWTETTGKEAIFTNLSPGTYQFELLVANGNGFWSKYPRIVKFRLKPSFHQSGAFKAGATLIVLMVVAGIVFLIMRKKQIRKNKEREVRKELVGMQVKTINAQLDPHFIFNAITAIGSEVQEKNHDKAYAYFVKVSQLLRNSLKNTDKITRTIAEELRFVENYLSLQKFRFEERFDYNIIIDQAVVLKKSVPKMCVQIFVENAMRHGIEQLSGGGLLQVSVSKKNNRTVFIIEDNGIGRAASAKAGTRSNGVGLQVFSEFFEIMNRYNNEPAGFVIHDLFNEKSESAGTRVELTIPDSYQYEIQ